MRDALYCLRSMFAKIDKRTQKYNDLHLSGYVLLNYTKYTIVNINSINRLTDDLK